MILRKGFNGSVKDVDKAGRIVTGYFSTFDFRDSDGDIIVAGAFKRTVRENGPKGKDRVYHLWQHWSDEILSAPHVLKEDDIGLYFESKIAPTTKGNDALILYQEGILKEHSIGFEIINNDRQPKANYIKEIRLWEGSTVTWGANERARSTGMKSMSHDDLMKRIDCLEKAVRNGTYTDETIILLIKELEYIKESLRPIISPEPTNVVEAEQSPEPTSEELFNEFKKGLNG